MSCLPIFWRPLGRESPFGLLLDFEATSAVDRTRNDFAQWELESAHTYDVHPIPLVRYRIFPEILAGVIGQCSLGPSPETIRKVQAEMRNEVEFLIFPRFNLSLPEVITYRNERAPTDLQEISIPMSLVRSYYEMAFEALAVLMSEWHDSRHPLALLTMLFHSEWLHGRARDLAKQFRKKTPRNSPGLFENIAGMAGARLCRDFFPDVDEGLLEIRARNFLSPVSGFWIPHPEPK